MVSPELMVGVLVALVLIVALWLLRGRRTAPPRPAGLPDDLPRVFTDHARQRMGQREVTEDRVLATLLQPDAVLVDDQEQSRRFDRTFGSGKVSELVKVWVSAADEWPPQRQAVIKSTAAQRSLTVKVPADRVGRVIGRGGSTVKEIGARTGAKVSINDRGRVTIVADRADQVLAARDLVLRAAR